MLPRWSLHPQPKKQTHKNISTNTALSVWCPHHYTDQRPLNAIISQNQKLLIKALIFISICLLLWVHDYILCTTESLTECIYLKRFVLTQIKCWCFALLEINRFNSINTRFIITVNASSLVSTIISITNKSLFTKRNQQNCYIRPKLICQRQSSYRMVIQVYKIHLN